MSEWDREQKNWFWKQQPKTRREKNVHTNANDTSRKKRLPFKFEQFVPLSKRSAARGKKHWCASMSERVNVCAHFATESMYWTKGCARIWFQCLKIYIMFYVIYSNIYKAICSMFLAKKNNSDFVLFISDCRYENYCYQLHVIPLKRFHIWFFDNDQYMWAFSSHYQSVYALYSFTLTQTPNIHTHTGRRETGKRTTKTE